MRRKKNVIYCSKVATLKVETKLERRFFLLCGVMFFFFWVKEKDGILRGKNNWEVLNFVLFVCLG